MSEKLDTTQELIDKYKREHPEEYELIDHYNKKEINRINSLLHHSDVRLIQEYEDDPSEGESLKEEEPSTEEIENSDDEGFIDDSEIKKNNVL